jgi:carbon-monoxide dehydrogenase medium subunit
MDYIAPTTLAEVFDALDRYGEDARLLAGGTGLVNLMKQRLVQPACLINLAGLAEYSKVRPEATALTIGALVTQRHMETSAVIRDFCPLLADTYHTVGTVRIRNAATVGGGVAHGDPSQDPPVSLSVLGARVRLASRGGVREVALGDFLKDYYETDVRPGEVVTEVVAPATPARSGAVYMKFLPRTADDYATVSVAALVTLSDDGTTCREARIALGAVAPTVVRATAAEAALKGQALTDEAIRAAAATVPAAVDPLSDYRGSAEYKRDMTEVFARRALTEARARAQRALS